LRSPAASCPGFALQHGLLQKFWFNYMLSAFTTHVTIYFLVLLHIDSQCNFRLDYTFSHCSAQISQTHERDQRVEHARGILPRVCASATHFTETMCCKIYYISVYYTFHGIYYTSNYTFSGFTTHSTT
jgi:hypothetical protein